MQVLKSNLLSRLRTWARGLKCRHNHENPTDLSDFYAPYPRQLPPPPGELFAMRSSYELALRKRRYIRLPGGEDTPLFALYRLYEAIVLGQTIIMRNEIEQFFRRHEWVLHDIPDPQDSNPERYAVLACIPHLLIAAFNRNIKLGLARDAPAIMTQDYIDEMMKQPRKYEDVPDWVYSVPRLKLPLLLPSYRNIYSYDPKDHVLEWIEDEDDERLSPVFKDKNIFIWSPDIFFI